jgi:PAS domain S-box-containing protein
MPRAAVLAFNVRGLMKPTHQFPREKVDRHSNTPDEPPTAKRESLRTGVQGTPPTKAPPARETLEREDARRRGRARRAAGDAGHDPAVGRADPSMVHHAFAPLAENVRDYAIFLMDPDGIIRFWGEGARLMKRWTKEEAEGGHLRLLYPDGGSEDGTAEEHLVESAERGEYVGEGHRMRGDGKTLWARVTLTALKDENNTLLGFAKVTIDLTVQRFGDISRALQKKGAALGDAQAEREDLRAEIEVLKEELDVLRRELNLRDQELADAAEEP